MTSTPPVRKTMPQAPAPVAKTQLAFASIGKASGHRVLLYGSGGIGKTTLAAQAPGPVVFIDLDDSLAMLATHQDLSAVKLLKAASWLELRNLLNSDGWNGIDTIVIDTVTRAEEMAVAHTLATVKTEKGNNVDSVESYGYGKGLQHVYETFLPLMADLDKHRVAGRNVVLIAHDCTANVPNPSGDDWIRYEPRLQSPASGKASIRLRMKEWADHVLFMAYDVAVNKEGKGVGSGTRTIYTAELPSFMAKSRTTSEPIPVESGSQVWSNIIK